MSEELAARAADAAESAYWDAVNGRDYANVWPRVVAAVADVLRMES